MALSLKTLFGAGPAKGRGDDDAEFDEPTTQAKMGRQPAYDPLAAVSIMEQMRTSNLEVRQPGRLWLIGHLPIVRQFQVLGALLVVFLLLALFMLYLNTRVSAQATASTGSPVRLVGVAAAMRTGTMRPIKTSGPWKCTGCR